MTDDQPARAQRGSPEGRLGRLEAQVEIEAIHGTLNTLVDRG